MHLNITPPRHLLFQVLARYFSDPNVTKVLSNSLKFILDVYVFSLGYLNVLPAINYLWNSSSDEEVIFQRDQNYFKFSLLPLSYCAFWPVLSSPSILMILSRFSIKIFLKIGKKQRSNIDQANIIFVSVSSCFNSDADGGP